MKWLGRRESDNVEDRRGMSGGRIAAGGGIIGIIAIVITLLTGHDPTQLLNALQQNQGSQATASAPDPAQDEMAKFIKVALADNEDVWKKIFSDNNMTYQDPKLVLFSGATESGCGDATSSTGPFYCPADQKVYIDLSFMNELKERFGAKGGDFALAYVLSHEVGHHVQNLMGVSSKVNKIQQQSSEKEGNKFSVALELQADFYAGVWAHFDDKMNHVLEDGDIEQALDAASAVGDDAIQKKTQGQVVPDAFTHGTSQQRMYWFKRGFDSGDLSKGNTFKEMGLTN